MTRDEFLKKWAGGRPQIDVDLDALINDMRDAYWDRIGKLSLRVIEAMNKLDDTAKRIESHLGKPREARREPWPGA